MITSRISQTLIVLHLLALLSLTFVRISNGQATRQEINYAYPYSTNENYITIFAGNINANNGYTPLFIKGVNLGIATPGTFPGSLSASKQEYLQWFTWIREAGFNTIRIYTRHYPVFYEALKQFNEASPNSPLLVFHGVWLEEEIVGYDEDLFSLTEIFENEIVENLGAVHGDITIEPSPGKSSGTYTHDISPWVIGYILGREIHPPEVLHTNESHPDITSYDGEYLSISDVQATEAWLVERMDFLIKEENFVYSTVRPVSVSSWPSLDPLSHPFEPNTYETMAKLDLENINTSNAPAGFFVSYHAYPYYPNYISEDPKYLPFTDHIGQNSYLGYLTYLKQHYSKHPLIIAEYGAPSSWGTAHFANNGIHHGGYSETEQGQHFMRLIHNTDQAGTGGGIQFAFMDEWFKRTWITDPFDNDVERRILWHNVTAAEQNFGIVGFRKKDIDDKTLLADFGTQRFIRSITGSADYAYLNFELSISSNVDEKDSLWIALDTYDSSLGESVLPDGKAISNRAEFALLITNYEAKLYVKQSYDTFGYWHGTMYPGQLLRSTTSDGEPWRLVRWKNDASNEISQDIGNMSLNRLGLPQKSTDGVRLTDSTITIRLPWTLINVTDPSRRQVLHDDDAANPLLSQETDGVALTLYYNGNQYETPRYLWAPWNHTLDSEPYLKQSFHIVKEENPNVAGNPIAKFDVYELPVDTKTYVPSSIGVLINDWSLDGQPMSAFVDEAPMHGKLNLEPDGSFDYTPNQSVNYGDRFTYRVRAGNHISESTAVTLNLTGTPKGTGFLNIYPNPTADQLTLTSPATISYVEIFDLFGRILQQVEINSVKGNVDVSDLSPGVYSLKVVSKREYLVRKFTVVR